MSAPPSKKRILILGGGFGGVYTARHLERLFKRRADVEIVLVSHDNFLLMTPLLFEVFSGTLDVRQCSFPLRAFLKTTQFVEAKVRGIDLKRRIVHLDAAGESVEMAYDQLVLALGAMTNLMMIPGSEHAFTFMTLADALLLRNHVIERFERADVEPDPRRKRQQLTFTIIGGGLVGVELFGELTAFVDGIAPLYKHVNRAEVRRSSLRARQRPPTISPRSSSSSSTTWPRPSTTTMFGGLERRGPRKSGQSRVTLRASLEIFRSRYKNRYSVATSQKVMLLVNCENQPENVRTRLEGL